MTRTLWVSKYLVGFIHCWPAIGILLVMPMIIGPCSVQIEDEPKTPSYTLPATQ